MHTRNLPGLILLLLCSRAVAIASGPLIQFVSPGQSIQAAINRAPEGGWILIQPGTYRETADSTNGLTITRGVNLIGLSTADKKVVLANSGGQRNGIVAVPPAHTNCMSCHSSMAPPFDLLPGVDRTLPKLPSINGLTISGITIQGFINNGLFGRNLRNFAFTDVHSVGNKNYGIFPTLSQNGLIAGSSASGADDTGIWIETSQNVTATHNVAEGNVAGFEVSNSSDVLLAENEIHGNSVGAAILFLPGIFADRPDNRRITVRANNIHDNNKTNTGQPGSAASFLPPGVGIFHLGSDDSEITGNSVENHNLSGIALADYCLALQGSELDCSNDPSVSPEFLRDNAATNNRVTRNRLRNNGVAPDTGNPFAFAAGDITVLTESVNGNCFASNSYSTFFSTLGVLPSCR